MPIDSLTSPPIEPTGRLWDVADVAAYLACSKSAVFKWAERGELPCLRVGPTGRLLRFDPEAVKRWARGSKPEARGRVVTLHRERAPEQDPSGGS